MLHVDNMHVDCGLWSCAVCRECIQYCVYCGCNPPIVPYTVPGWPCLMEQLLSECCTARVDHVTCLVPTMVHGASPTMVDDTIWSVMYEMV